MSENEKWLEKNMDVIPFEDLSRDLSDFSDGFLKRFFYYFDEVEMFLYTEKNNKKFIFVYIFCRKIGFLPTPSCFSIEKIVVEPEWRNEKRYFLDLNRRAEEFIKKSGDSLVIDRKGMFGFGFNEESIMAIMKDRVKKSIMADDFKCQQEFVD